MATLTVVPARWLDRYGRRPATVLERDAAALFYHRLGQRMAAPDTPATYEGMALLYDQVRRDRMRRAEGSVTASDRTIGRVAASLPRPWGALVRPVLAVLLDPVVADAVGLPPPRRGLRALVHGGLRARRLVLKSLPPRRTETTPRTRRRLPPLVVPTAASPVELPVGVGS